MENEICTVRQFLFLLFTFTVGATLVWIQLIEKADRPKIRPMQTEFKNSPVPSRILYQPGHRISPNGTCPNHGDGMKLLILVTTAVGHSKQRQAVRATWGLVTSRPDVGLAFVVGISANPEDNQAVEEENRIHGDFIQGNFIDSYNNLTLKTISILEWSRDHCSRVKYLLKTDDDMYIHMPVLFKILDRSVDRKRSIMGLVAKKWRPVRNNKSKYFLSRNEYKPVLFPDFTTGPAYVITNDVFDALYEASLNGTFFRFEDVYLTGTIADQLGIRRVHLPEFRNSRLKLNPCVVNKIATVHMVNPIEMDVLYKKLQGNLTNCKFPAPKRGEAKI